MTYTEHREILLRKTQSFAVLIVFDDAYLYRLLTKDHINKLWAAFAFIGRNFEGAVYSGRIHGKRLTSAEWTEGRDIVKSYSRVFIRQIADLMELVALLNTLEKR